MEERTSNAPGRQLEKMGDTRDRGLEADQKVLAAHGCYAMTATTALTAQNTLGVEGVHITPPAFVGKQITACLDDMGADVVKIGRPASHYPSDRIRV